MFQDFSPRKFASREQLPKTQFRLRHHRHTYCGGVLVSSLIDFYPSGLRLTDCGYAVAKLILRQILVDK